MDASELADACRLCLDKERVTIHIFEGEGVERELYHKIGSCLPVKLATDDPLPKKICDDCSEKLEVVYNFWNTAVNAERQLYDWLGFSEPIHRTPMDVLKTEMMGDDSAGEMDLDESQDPLDREGPEGSEEESGGEEGEDQEDANQPEEDSGGGVKETSKNAPSIKTPTHPPANPPVNPPANVTINLPVTPPQPKPPLNISQPSTSNTSPSTGFSILSGPSRIPGISGISLSALTGLKAQLSGLKPAQSAHLVLTPPPPPQVYNSTTTAPLIDKEACRDSDSNETGGKKGAPSRTQKETCEVCGKKYVASFMPVHMRTHTGGKALDCPLCGTSFLHPKALRSHMVCHSDYRPFSCEVCQRKFKRNNELNMHMKIHSGEKAFKCDLCDYSCVQKSNLVIHKKRHSNEYKFMCDICNKGCYTNQELQKHRMTHMDITYKCKVCDKEFRHRYGLTIHEKKHDPNYEPPVGQFKCDICEKSYVKQSGLKAHMRQHNGVRPYTCGECGKSVSSKAILEVHSRRHTGEKPHICEVCGKMFTSKRYLDTHIRTHTGEKPFKCNVCGKSFTQHSTLIVHSRYHTGKRPHVCPVCGKGFVLRCQLKSHQKSANHFEEMEVDGDECIVEQDEPDETSIQETEVADETSIQETEVADETSIQETEVADETSIQETEVADETIVVTSTNDTNDFKITCYGSLDLSGKIIFSCSTCQKTFEDKDLLIVHREKCCRLDDQLVKNEPSDSE